MVFRLKQIIMLMFMVSGMISIVSSNPYAAEEKANRVCELRETITKNREQDRYHYYTNEDAEVREYLIEVNKLLTSNIESECVDFKQIANIAISSTGWICSDEDGLGLTYDECKNRLITSDLIDLYIKQHLSTDLVWKYIEFLDENQGSASEYMSFISEDIFILDPNLFLGVMESLNFEDSEELLGHLTWGLLNNDYGWGRATTLEIMKSVYGETIDYQKYEGILSRLFYSLHDYEGCSVMKLISDRSDPDRQKQVVEELYRNRGLYKQVLLDYITKEREWNSGEMIVTQDIALEAAIMIAGISGDHDYVDPLFNLLRNDDYASTCIYDCAVTFALSVLADEDDIVKIKELEKEASEYESGDIVGAAAYDVISAWKRFADAQPAPLEMRRKQAKELIQIANDEEQAKYEKLTELSQAELIQLSEDYSNEEYLKGLLPLTALRKIADNEDAIVKLLGIMVTIDPGFYDGADEYRDAIIRAIRNVLIQKKVPTVNSAGGDN